MKTSLQGDFSFVSQHFRAIYHKIHSINMEDISPEIKKHSSVSYLKAIHHHDLLLVDSDDDLAVCHALCASVQRDFADGTTNPSISIDSVNF